MEYPAEHGRALSRKKLLLIMAAGLFASVTITVFFVLPVEFQLDLTGFGRMAGLTRPTNPSGSVPGSEPSVAGGNSAARYYETAFRTATVEIPLTAPDRWRTGSELEYKVRIAAGQAIVYSWSVDGVTDPDDFYFDFHGETPKGPDNPEAKVIEYRQENGLRSSGVLVAPISGVHGWYFQNVSPKSVVVRLKVSGFFELVPPGEYGNDSRILPVSITD